ncbi:sulfatase-like hydrolase/transferase [Paenibacillus thalictri]|nr:sulfatase-like hydrolase/transferase [Paenibacillus thalictri]
MNVLVIMSDEHSHQAMGCSGHGIVKTPNLDKLAREGVMFNQCYTNSPLCTPARASFFTGRYVHEMGTWDNATPYDGKMEGISHRLHEHGLAMTSFGKLDFHPEGRYPGLDAPRPKHRSQVDAGAFFRSSNQPRPKVEERFKKIKVRQGDSYDDGVRDEAIEWLKGKKPGDESWMLYVGFLHPHFPFLTKQRHWDDYNERVKDIPEAAKPPFASLNEPLKSLRTHFGGESVDEETIRKSHVGYYSLIAEMDENIGQLLTVLEEQGLKEDTLIIYTSDHGEQLGNHGLWFKCCMFEESARIPLIMRGPGVRQGAVEETLVSLVDIYPTVCEALRVPVPEHIKGRSLLGIAKGRQDTGREDYVFSEYHAHGMPVGMYMIRYRHYKYVYFTGGYKPQLFDLEADPREMHDLNRNDSVSDEVQAIIGQCHSRLLDVCDPEAVDTRAQAFQEQTRISLGISSYTQADPASVGGGEKLPVPFPEYMNADD